MRWYTNPTFWLFFVLLAMCIFMLSGCSAASVQRFAEYKADLALRTWLTSLGPLIK